MTRALTLAGYAVIVAAMVATQAVAMVSRRVPTLGTVVHVVTRTVLGRAALVAAWLWLGWHLFVRAHH